MRAHCRPAGGGCHFLEFTRTRVCQLTWQRTGWPSGDIHILVARKGAKPSSSTVWRSMTTARCERHARLIQDSVDPICRIAFSDNRNGGNRQWVRLRSLICRSSQRWSRYQSTLRSAWRSASFRASGLVRILVERSHAGAPSACRQRLPVPRLLHTLQLVNSGRECSGLDTFAAPQVFRRSSGVV